LIHPASAKEIYVGIGCSTEETVVIGTCMSKVQEDPTWKTNKTQNHLNKAFIREISMATPHHKSRLVLDRGQLDLTSQSSHANERKDKGVQPNAGSMKLKLDPITILKGDKMKTSIKESDDVLKFSRHRPLSPPGYNEMGRKMKGKTGKSLVDHTNWKGMREDINGGRTDVNK
jgi:hypothetical protein